MPTDPNRDFSFEHPGFSAFSGKPNPRQHHRHDEVELAIFEHGSLVALLKVSRVHVMRQFRKVTGMSVLDYITQQRVSCAQRLLATTDMKLLDIAAEAGFRSTARFYPCFKRLVGESPARYRRSLQIMSETERVSISATA